MLGRYRLERVLGTGGFGAVWRARDERLKRPVAVKVIPRSASAAPRVRREALAAARLSHPAIVALHEAGEDDEALYLVSELVEGRTLDRLAADGALSDRDVLEAGVALCDALAHAHERGVVHRDVKPQNVIRAKGGEVKLTDFGIAHLVGDEPLTRTGDVLGTLAYMAPEQARGRPADTAADVYSLGLVLYEALAGVNPVRAGTPAATARRLGRPLPPLRRFRRDLPAELCAALDAAVRPRPAERPVLGELREALRAALPAAETDRGLLAPQPGPAPDPARGERAARILAGLAAGSLALTILAAAGPAPPLPPAAAGGVAAALVAALPRAGWLACAVALLAWLTAAGEPGTALVALPAVALVPALLPRDGAWWSVPALAPVLGLAALAPAYAAVAGRAATARRRAAAGALGGLWLCVAAPLLGRTLFTAPDAPPAAWEADAATAAREVLAPLATSGALLAVPLLALAALVLPWLVADRALPLAAAGAVAWAAGLAVAAGTLAAAVGLGDPRGAVAGAVAGAALAFGGRLPAEPRAAPAPIS